MRKRILSMFVAVIMVISLMPITVFAIDGLDITNKTPQGEEETNHGYITIDKDNAAEGETVTITVNPAEGYQLESLSVEPTISTIADVLATVTNFPTSTDQNVVPDNAWHSGTNHFAYVYTTALLIRQPADEDGSKKGWTPILLNKPVTRDGDSYTYSHTIFNLRFKMEDGILTSIEITGTNATANAKHDGTYVPAITPSGPEKIIPQKQTDDKYTFTMPNYPVAVTAVFAEAPAPAHTITINVDDATKGSVNPEKLTDIEDGSAYSVNGNTLTIKGTSITATAKDGFEFDCWKNGETIVTNSGTITTDTTFTATFKTKSHTHSLVKVNGQEPTETSSGWYDYYECQGEGACHQYFEDSSGNVPISDINAWKSEGGNGYRPKLTPGPTYTITVTNDGNGDASANVNEAASGTTITLTATPDSGYEFDKWVVTEGSVTISNDTFTMPAANVTVKAIFKSATSGPTPPEPGPKPDPDTQGNYLDPLYNLLEEAIKTGNTDTIYWDAGNALPNAIMKILFNNPTLSLDFKFTYEGVEYEIYIGPGQATNDDIEWYGPLWLLGQYGNKKDNVSAVHGVYVIQEGDTLNKIARKFNTTVDALLILNPDIKDRNLIYPGYSLNY